VSIAVRLPSTLTHGRSDALTVDEPVADLAALMELLARRVPGFREQMDGALLNVAVNGELILHDLARRPLHDGDSVEIVPTISGGRQSSRADR
jgi:molybdopterin converting factor small subunit